MPKTYPGTTVEVTELRRGDSRALFDGIFAAGGITLSQVSVMTGLEPHVIQNWVKRGFVTSPRQRTYSKEQFARIVIINILREELQIDRICRLMRRIDGDSPTPEDDLIPASELYHRYTDLLAALGDAATPTALSDAALRATENYPARASGDRERLCKILCLMHYAHVAANLRTSAEEMLASVLDE